jgi:hypothetical protein
LVSNNPAGDGKTANLFYSVFTFVKLNKVWTFLLTQRDIITINVPLFKKLRDIIFFLRDNNFLSRFETHFEGAKTFLTP